MTNQENPNKVVVERVFNAPVERIWSALTASSEVRQWYFDIPNFKPEVGFEFGFVVEHEGNRYDHRCKITEVVPRRRLAYSWRYEGHEGDSLVTFELEAQDDKTRLRLTHVGLDSFPRTAAFKRENFKTGWTAITQELQQYLEAPATVARS